MDGPANIRLQIESNTLFLSGVRELVYHVASRIGFSDEHCGQMALATDEAICNVIRHGYGRAADRPIWISLRCIGGVATPENHGTYPTTGLEITIEDEARQVDLTQIKSRDLDEIRPGGLGVHIIQQVMDDVRYEHRGDLGGKGMRLTMVKLRTAPAESVGPEQPEKETKPEGVRRGGSGCNGPVQSGMKQGGAGQGGLSPAGSSPANSSPANASPANASPANASPADAGPTDSSPTGSIQAGSIQGSAANCPAGDQQRSAKEHGR